MSDKHKRPVKVRRRSPTVTAPQNVVVVMPKLKWSKLAGYPNGSKNLYHNNATMGLRTVVHLARNQTLQQYFNTYKKFPNGNPMPGYIWNNSPREPGELRRAIRKNATFVLAPGARTSKTKNATFKYYVKSGVFSNKPTIYKGKKVQAVNNSKFNFTSVLLQPRRRTNYFTPNRKSRSTVNISSDEWINFNSNTRFSVQKVGRFQYEVPKLDWWASRPVKWLTSREPKNNRGNLPNLPKYTPAASRLLGNNNLVINQFGTFLNNSNTIKNLVSKAVTKAKLREILRKNLNAGVKKIQAKTKARQNFAQTALNKQRERLVANMVNGIMKSVKSVGPKVNTTVRKPTPAYTGERPKVLKNAGPAPVKKTKPNGYNAYRNSQKLTNAQLNALMRAGLVNLNNLRAAEIKRLTSTGFNNNVFSGKYLPPLRFYADPERTGKSTKTTNRKPTNKLEKPTVTKTKGPAKPPSPKKSARAQKPPMSELFSGTMKPALPGPGLSKKTSEELIKKAVNAMVEKPKAWTNAQMMNHEYKRGPGFKLGGSDCETKSKEELVAMLRKYGYDKKPIPKHYTKAVLCQKLKQVHNSYLGLNVNGGNNNYMKEWLKR